MSAETPPPGGAGRQPGAYEPPTHVQLPGDESSTSAAERAQQGVQDAATTAQETAASAASTVQQTAEQAAAGVREAASHVAAGAQQAASQVASGAQQAAEQAAAGVREAAGQAAGSAQATVSQLTTTLRERPETQKAAALFEQRPELEVALAFAGGLLVAQILKRLGS